MQPWHMHCRMHACMDVCLKYTHANMPVCLPVCLLVCLPAYLGACCRTPPPNPALFNMLTAAYGGQSLLHCWPPEPLPPGEAATAASAGCVPTGALQGPPHWLEHCLKRSHGAWQEYLLGTGVHGTNTTAHLNNPCSARSSHIASSTVSKRLRAGMQAASTTLPSASESESGLQDMAAAAEPCW